MDDRGRSRASTSSRASSRSAMRGTSSEGDYGGTFADDEPDSTLQAAQASKSSGSTSRGGGTAKVRVHLRSRSELKWWQMGIKLAPAPAQLGPVTKSRHKRPKATNDDLPFTPQQYRDNLKRWQTLCIGYIVEWAGSTEDAFAAGPSHPGFNGAVELAWSKHFPDIEITEAVYYLVCGACFSGLSSRDSHHRLPVHCVTGAVRLGSVPLVISPNFSSNGRRTRTRLNSSALTTLLLNLKI